MSTSNNLIFNNLLDNIATLTNKHLDSFKFSQSDLYQQYNDIPNSDKLIYFFIIIFVFIFLNKFDIQLKQIFALILSFLVISVLLIKSNSNVKTFNKNKQLQLDFLNKLMFNDNRYIYASISDFDIKPTLNKSYLYLNPAIVEFFYNIREYSQLNTAAYVDSIIHANNLIGINEQVNIGVIDIYQNYNVAYEEYKKSLKSLSYVIYNLTTTHGGKSDEKYNKSLIILQELLLNIIENIARLCNINTNKTGYNIHTVPTSIIKSNSIINPSNPNINEHEYF